MNNAPLAYNYPVSLEVIADSITQSKLTGVVNISVSLKRIFQKGRLNMTEIDID